MYVNFQRNEGHLNQEFKIIDKKGNIKSKLEDFAVANYHNNIVLDKNYILDRIDGSLISKNFSKEANGKVTLSTNNPNAIKWIGITIGKSTIDNNTLRKKLYEKTDNIKLY